MTPVTFSPDTLTIGRKESTVRRRRHESSDQSQTANGYVNLSATYDLPRCLYAANRVREMGDIVICRTRTWEDRNSRRREVTPYSYRLYQPFVFFIHRVVPSIPLLWRAHRFFVGERVFSLTEVLGCFIAHGFAIQEYIVDDRETYITVKKVKETRWLHRSSGAFIGTFSRIGKDDAVISVYKIRTMYRFAEYLEGYLYDQHGTPDGDKIRNDFRATWFGRLLRRCWLDELPTLLNYLKGDMKLVGVRPLSQHKASLYPRELLATRTRVKPGLIPPFYADLPRSQHEFFETERRYLLAYAESPVRTDVRYGLRALANIILRRTHQRQYE